MPLILNRNSSSFQFPSYLASNSRGKGHSRSPKKRVKKKYKNGHKTRREYSKVESKFSLTPALATILENLGYKIKKRGSS